MAGRRVSLREIEESDLGLIAAWRNQPRSLRCFVSAKRIDVNSQQQWFAGYLARTEELMWIIQTASGQPIGTIALCDIDLARQRAELGRVLIGEESCLRLGYAKEATCRVLQYAFEDLGCQLVTLEVLKGNEAATGLYTSCGFRTVAAGRRAASAEEALKDVLEMAITRGEWLAKRAADRDGVVGPLGSA
jgi:RimJ/RimL family protein N-acetyltransferase